MGSEATEKHLEDEQRQHHEQIFTGRALRWRQRRERQRITVRRDERRVVMLAKKAQPQHSAPTPAIKMKPQASDQRNISGVGRLPIRGSGRPIVVWGGTEGRGVGEWCVKRGRNRVSPSE